MENSKIIDNYFQPKISDAFIYKVSGGYALKVILSDYSYKANMIKKANIIINNKDIKYSINEKGIETKPFKLKSEKNIKSRIEIETVLGTNNPIVLNKKLTIAPSIDFNLAQDIIQISNYQYRSALVIGNSRYNNARDRLKNPVNDAKDVANELKKLNFTVVEKFNLSATEMKKVINDFSEKLKNNDEVRVFYYSGHGFEVNNKNYMLPIDDRGVKSISLDDTLNTMGNYKNVLNIAILDTCRDNFFSKEVSNSKKLRDIFKKRGLVRINSKMDLDRVNFNIMSSGTIKAFSTASSKSAYDGIDGENGIYTRFLIKHLKNSNTLSVETLLKLVSKEVQDKTKDKIRYSEIQVPWVESSYIGSFSFSTAK